MALSNFDKNMDIIAALHDEPNVDDGLSASALKAKFDEGGKAIQTYINGTLKSYVEGLATGTNLADGAVTAAKIADGAVTSSKIAADAVNDVYWGDSSTTNSDINTALANGKLPIIVDSGRYYVYLKKDSNSNNVFNAFDGSTLYELTRKVASWDMVTLDLTQYDEVTTITDSATSAQVEALFQANKSVRYVTGTHSVYWLVSRDNDHKHVFASFGQGPNILIATLENDTWTKVNNGIAPKASPAFTGTPTAPTAAPGTNTTQIATTAFVQSAISGKADSSSVHSIPSGGTSGYVLKKASSTDYDVEWAAESGGGGGLPSGGSTGQALVKASSTDYDVEWADMQDVYWATYNDTTTLTLGTKFSGARFVACKYGDRDYILTEKVSSTDYIFTAVDNGKVYWLENNNNTWTNGSFDIPSLATATPSALGTAAVGSSTKAAKEDHVHAMPSASDVGAVASSQGVAHAGEFLVVGNDGNVTTVTMTAWQGGSY